MTTSLGTLAPAASSGFGRRGHVDDLALLDEGRRRRRGGAVLLRARRRRRRVALLLRLLLLREPGDVVAVVAEGRLLGGFLRLGLGLRGALALDRLGARPGQRRLVVVAALAALATFAATVAVALALAPAAAA